MGLSPVLQVSRGCAGLQVKSLLLKTSLACPSPARNCCWYPQREGEAPPSLTPLEGPCPISPEAQWDPYQSRSEAEGVRPSLEGHCGPWVLFQRKRGDWPIRTVMSYQCGYLPLVRRRRF